MVMTEEQLRKMREGRERWEREKLEPGYVPVQKRLTPMKAIRAKCLECSCGSSNEVRLCEVTTCPLYDFRFGKKPSAKTNEILDEDIEDEDFTEDDASEAE